LNNWSPGTRRARLTRPPPLCRSYCPCPPRCAVCRHHRSGEYAGIRQPNGLQRIGSCPNQRRRLRRACGERALLGSGFGQL
jgi:hypothetical protein